MDDKKDELIFEKASDDFELEAADSLFHAIQTRTNKLEHVKTIFLDKKSKITKHFITRFFNLSDNSQVNTLVIVQAMGGNDNAVPDITIRKYDRGSTDYDLDLVECKMIWPSGAQSTGFGLQLVTVNNQERFEYSKNWKDALPPSIKSKDPSALPSSYRGLCDTVINWINEHFETFRKFKTETGFGPKYTGIPFSAVTDGSVDDVLDVCKEMVSTYYTEKIARGKNIYVAIGGGGIKPLFLTFDVFKENLSVIPTLRVKDKNYSKMSTPQDVKPFIESIGGLNIWNRKKYCVFNKADGKSKKNTDFFYVDILDKAHNESAVPIEECKGGSFYLNINLMGMDVYPIKNTAGTRYEIPNAQTGEFLKIKVRNSEQCWILINTSEAITINNSTFYKCEFLYNKGEGNATPTVIMAVKFGKVSKEELNSGTLNFPYGPINIDTNNNNFIKHILENDFKIKV